MNKNSHQRETEFSRTCSDREVDEDNILECNVTLDC